MKNLIFKFWMINLLLTIGLFVLHRMFFMETKVAEGSSFNEFLNMMYMVLNMHFVMFYVFVMFLCSLTFYLNLNGFIRKNYFLSLLSFVGVPAFTVVYYIIDFIVNRYSTTAYPAYQSGRNTFIVDFIAFPLFYLIMISIEFLFFRKMMKKHE